MPNWLFPSTADINNLHDRRKAEQDALGLLPGDAEGFHPLAAQFSAQAQGMAPEQYAEATQGNGVGVFGKLLGNLGLDAEGHRAAQSWGKALAQTAGTLIDPVGTAGHFVQGVDQSFQDLDRLLQHPSSHDPEWSREIARPAFDLTSTVAMGGGAVPKQAGTAGTFGGRLAKTADHARETLFSNSKEASAPGIVAYHGSPHDFDRFDMSKIGTGEGAQAYGHGLYFADSEGVANSYREKLAKINPTLDDSGNPVNWNAAATQAADKVRRFGTREKAADFLADIIKQKQESARKSGASERAITNHLASSVEELNLLRSQEPIPGIHDNPGRMYQVRINADPEHFLDWDKPLGEQSRFVKDAIAKAEIVGSIAQKIAQENAELASLSSMFGAKHAPEWITPETYKGQDIVKALPGGTGDLHGAGIPGIKYLDQGSRAAGDGSRNYVVFDDKIVDILKKYGLLGTLGAGGASLSPFDIYGTQQ